MIDIVINGVTLPLPASFVLNREVETKIFNKEIDAYDFNYPIDLPATDDARKALGFPDIIATSIFKKEYPATLIIESTYQTGVKVKVLSVSQKTKTIRIAILGQYASLADIFGDKRVCDLEMGGFQILEMDVPGFDDIEYTFGPHIEDGLYDYGELRIKYTGAPVNAYMTAVAKGDIDSDFLFPKVIDINPDLPGNQGGYSVINAYDHDRDRYVDADLYNAMAQPWKYMPSVSPTNAFENEQRHFWVPMYKVIKVIKACFEEFGLTVDGSIFSDIKFEKKVLLNTYALNFGANGQYIEPAYPATPYFIIQAGYPKAFLTPKNHLPKMKIIEFLNELGKRFNWQWRYDMLTKHVTIQEDRNLSTATTNIIDLSSKINPEAIISFERQDAFLNGYKFEFETDGADMATSENVQNDIADYSFRGSIEEESMIGAISSPEVNDVVFVKNTNTYWKYEQDIGFVLYSHNIGSYSTTTNENLEQVSTKIISCPMGIYDVKMITLFGGSTTAATLIGTYYTNSWESVPFCNIGMSYDSYNYMDWDTDNGIFYVPGGAHPWEPHQMQAARKPAADHLPHIINCVGFQPGIIGSDREYFMATSGSYNSRGDTMDVYSCAWQNPENFGIFEDWWKAFVDSIKDSASVEYDALLDLVTYNNIDVNSSVIKIDELKFLMKKASFVMPFPELCKLELVKI